MLDVRRLQVLREVARRGSLAAAADALTFTPSAVSQQIAALEREAGVTLLERRARGILLTEAGRLLVEHAERVLDAVTAAESALAELSAVRRGVLRLASFATASATVLPRAVDAFRSSHPDVEVRVQQATSLDGVSRVRDGHLDLALTVDQKPTRHVEVIDLFGDPFRVALHRTHPAAASPVLRLADLASERWIDVPRETPGGDVLVNEFGRLGVQYRAACESEDYTAIHELVGAGLGVALLPDLALFPPNVDVVLRSLGPDAPTRCIQAATRPQPLRSAAASAMLELLRALEPRRRGSVLDAAAAAVTDQAAGTAAPSR